MFTDAWIHGVLMTVRMGRFLNGRVIAFCAVRAAAIKVEVRHCLLERPEKSATLLLG
jgi:hypothetical protein